MFDTNLLDILCCPETRGKLKLAGSAKNVAGEKVSEPLTEALATEDGSRVYPVREGIPVLLADEAILL